MGKYIHGMRHEKIYKIWEAMKRRCDSPKCERYKDYGGRGITYCNEWKSFTGFYEWAKKNEYKKGLSIERIDVNGNYCPDNCKWITPKSQQYNKRNSLKISCFGETLTVAEWGERTGVPYSVIYQRIKRLKWPTEKAITEPVRLGRNQFGYAGKNEG